LYSLPQTRPKNNWAKLTGNCQNLEGSIVAFLQEQSDPIVDPSQYEVMKTNFSITKSMSETELKALEEYILGFSK